MNIIAIIGTIAGLGLAAAFAVRAIGGNIALAADWKKAATFYSSWAIVVLGSLPDIYNAVVTSGLLEGTDAPEKLTWAARVLAVGGLMLRLVNQKKPAEPDFGADK